MFNSNTIKIGKPKKISMDYAKEFLNYFSEGDILVLERIINMQFRRSTLIKFINDKEFGAYGIKKSDGNILFLLPVSNHVLIKPDRFRKANDREMLLYYTQGSDVLVNNGMAAIMSEKIGIVRDSE